MSEAHLKQLIAEIKALKKLTAAVAVRNVKPQKEQIRLLNAAGLTPSEIADVLGTSANTVSVALSVMKKTAKAKAAKEAADLGAAGGQSQA